MSRCTCGVTIPPGHALCGSCWRTAPTWVWARVMKADWRHGGASAQAHAARRTARHYAQPEQRERA